jgi:hypothetical protein
MALVAKTKIHMFSQQFDTFGVSRHFCGAFSQNGFRDRK